MKKVELCISSCDECPHYGCDLGFHEDNRHCDLLKQDVRYLDKDDNGFPIICPLETINQRIIK